MAQIKNIEGLSLDDIHRALDNGAKFVVFEYCISIVVMTFKRSSDVYFLKAGQPSINHSLLYTFITFFLGWWGIPWGPIYSIGSLYTNLSGGKNVTTEIMESINSQNA